jgi:hypothetical protein
MPPSCNVIAVSTLTALLIATPGGSAPFLHAAAADASTSPAIAGAGPTLAKEDTLHMDLPPVLVHAPRVTLAEILRRVAHGEARRESLLTDQTFIATTRIVRNPTSPRDTAELLRENVTRVYRKKPGKVRTEQLREWVAHPEKHSDTRVEFRAGMGERIVNYAFRPGAWRDFDYTIVGRDLVGGHVIYRIAFRPHSLLSTDPSGVVWVDTNEFVILRQEAHFEHSPMPLLLKAIDRMVVEREQVEGFWVLHRALIRIETTVPFPHFGRSFDVSLLFDRYAINRGLDDRLFAGRGGKPVEP